MGLYTRQQLVLLVVLVAAAGVGLGVAQWRAKYPEIVRQLERIERDISPGEDVVEPRAARGPDTHAPRTHVREERAARSRPSKRQIAPTGEPAAPLDLNQATLTDLTGLPGVGPVLARRILEARGEAGRFGAVEDLLSVRGVGRARLDRLRPLISVLE